MEVVIDDIFMNMRQLCRTIGGLLIRLIS